MILDNIEKQSVYAVQTGDYVGQLLVVVDVTKEYVGCLALPNMENVKVPADKWTFGRNSDILEYIENLSEDIYEVTEAQYKKNEDINN